MKRLLLAGIILLALALRLAGIGFGLPGLFHADEPVLVNHALAYGSGDLNPHFFKIPPLVSYLLFLAYGVFYLAGRVTGQFPSSAAFEQAFYADPSIFYLLARVLFGALLGSLTVFAVYRWVLRFFKRETLALTASFFLAVCFLHVRDSHYIYVDIPLVFVLVLAFGSLFEVVNNSESLKRHAIAGVWMGLATAVKYNGAALLIPYLFVLLFMRKARLFKKAACFAGAAALAFVILNPYALVDRAFFLQELAVQSRSNTGVPLFHHLFYSLFGSIGLPLLLAFGAGMVRSLFVRDLQRSALLAFVFGYYAVLVRAGQPYERYVLPLVPFALFFAADFIVAVLDRFPRWGSKGLAAAALVMALPTLTSSVLCDRLLMAEDTRTLAQDWIEKQVSPQSRLALAWNFYMPRLRFSKDQLLQKKKEIQAADDFRGPKQRKLDFLISEKAGPAYFLYFMEENPAAQHFLFATPNLPYDLSVLKANGIRYVVWARLTGQQEEFYDSLKREGELLARFSPYRDSSYVPEYRPDTGPLTGAPFLFSELYKRERNGQILEIYKLPETPV